MRWSRKPLRVVRLLEGSNPSLSAPPVGTHASRRVFRQGLPEAMRCAHQLYATGIPRGRANGTGMSAIGGIVPLPSPAEIAAGGNVVPLRKESPPVDQTGPEPASALGPVSPELAMVDPELRQAALELLPDLPRPVPQPVAMKGPWSCPCPASSSRSRSSHRLAAAADSVCSRRLPASSRSAYCSRWSSVARSSPSDALGRLNRSQPPFPQRPLRSPSRAHCTTPEPPPLQPRPPSLPPPLRRRRPPRPFTRAQFGGRRSSGSLPRTQRHTSSSCSRAASASSERASTRRETRTSGSLAASGPPSRPAAGELPLVRVDDRQGHESPVDEADGERKARDREEAALALRPTAETSATVQATACTEGNR